MTSSFHLSDIALVTVALAVAGAAGLMLGGVRIRGIGLGIGGVLFAGIATGHVAGIAGISFDAPALEFVREFGLILFVYTIGIQVGPGFFQSLRHDGLTLNLLAGVVVCLGVLTTVLVGWIAQIDTPALVGIMSGAVTNTPGLGAATQALKGIGVGTAEIGRPGLGYAVAYPFGIIGILVAMLSVRHVMQVNIDREAAAFNKASGKGDEKLPSVNIAMRNPALDGVRIDAIPLLADGGVVASRLLRDGVLSVPARDTAIRTGDVLHVVGPSGKLGETCRLLGEEAVGANLTTQGTDLTWERLVVTNTQVLGSRLRAIALEENYGVRISRVNRSGSEIAPYGGLSLNFGDILTIVGPRPGIQAARLILGDQNRRLSEVQYSAVFIGIALGVLVGSTPLTLPGMPAPLKLGLAGGPLVVAIGLARLGHFRGLVWFMPPVANQALRELGIVLFLAVVGITAGGRFVETLFSGEGVTWLLCGAAITLVPLMIVGFFARAVLRLNYLTLSGVLSGSMTDPPALAFASAQSASSPAPALGYAAVYPFVMCLRIIAPQILVLTTAFG